jgi:ATP-binding cassette subfamily B protein
MSAVMTGPPARRVNNTALRRAIGYLGNQRKAVIIAYGALIVATLAQLVVPLLVQNMINTVVNGVAANNVLGLPQQAAQTAAAGMGKTLEELTSTANNAERLILNAVLLILLFSVIRGVFAGQSSPWQLFRSPRELDKIAG